jgi:alpha-tubulin suppressor-like RCC1 family protein
VKIFSGGYGSTVFAVTDKGDTYAWGYNAYGTIGNASSTNQTSPQLISPTYIPKGVVDVKTWQGYDINSSGTEVTNWYTASMALLSSGEMYFTGNSKYGIAGDNAATNNYTLWHQISAKTTMDKLAASGGVYSDISDISLLTNVKQFDVTAGTIYPTVVAVTYDGQAYTWGYGGYGQLCMTDVTGTTLDSFIPVNITQSLLSSLDSSDIRNKVSKVLCARHAPRYSGQISWGTTYFQDTDGQLYGCGNNEHGYIPGQGTTTATGGKLAKIPLPCLPSEVADWKVIQISDAPAQGNSDQYRASNLLIITTDGRVYIAGSGNGAAAFGDGGVNTDASYGNRRSYWVQVAF